MRDVLRKVCAVAGTETTVLITGETGTGKNVLARIIHYNSRRRDHPFVSVQCSAVPETLLESELFGHEKGAFTGAIRRKPGKFELAHEGTIFLDEIGTVLPSAQVRLLQILEEREFHRVGGEETVRADVRVIAATNSDLQQQIREGNFRSDLYYRLNVFPIEVPPLRDRLEDIPTLVDVFIRRLEKVYRKAIGGVEPEVMEAFQSYSWPGNIRELENLLERAFVLENSPVLRMENFPADLFLSPFQRVLSGPDTSQTLRKVREDSIREVEAAYLRAVLRKHGGKIRESADNAGVGVRQMHKLLTRHGISKEDFKREHA
jgi:transcriptional regulator with GAF, ATPase, and Fis domain